jgi:hypothetical protein
MNLTSNAKELQASNYNIIVTIQLFYIILIILFLKLIIFKIQLFHYIIFYYYFLK